MDIVSRARRQVSREESTRFEAAYDGHLLSFAEFATCRLLRIPPSTETKGPIYKALVEIAMSYLRADVKAISCYITRYRMSALMSDITDEASTGPHDLELLKNLMLLLEKLLLEYLSENWDMIEHVLQVNRVAAMTKSESRASLSKLRNASSQALQAKDRARKNWQKAYRVAIKQIVLDTFGVKRTVVTMTQLFKELNRTPSSPDSVKSDLQKRRPPILLLLGGGMAAGKSTVREIIGSDTFWSKVKHKTGAMDRIQNVAWLPQVAKDAVVVEADAIKNQDIVFHALQDRLGDDPGISQLVHEYSTNAAESMLVRALNEQQDVVFDGTMTWLPFVEQTIAMARDHEHNYLRGPGYYHDEHGCVHEKYWEIDHGSTVSPGSKVPYRIELVGVTCDPGLAVARGIWRKIRTGRGVPVSSQLRSHRLFSQNFEAIARLVDSATLYHTGSNLTTFTHCDEEIKSPKVICHSSSVTRGELLVNPSAMKEFSKIRLLDDSATGVQTLYSRGCEPDISGVELEYTLSKAIGSGNISCLRHKLVEVNRAETEGSLNGHAVTLEGVDE